METEIFYERAVDIIEAHDPDDPLFMYLPFSAPHGPLQAPQSYIDMYNSTPGISATRQTYCGMVTALDDAIGYIKQALIDNGLFNDTIIIFTSDNGGQPHGGGNNYPLRGTKNTYWEGGSRVPGFVYYPWLDTHYVSSELFHATDWHPTILSMAGGESSDWTGVDGFDQWNTIRYNNVSVRDYVVYNIDESVYGYAAIRNKEFKLVLGDISPSSNNDDVVEVSDITRRDVSENSDDDVAERSKRSFFATKRLYKIDTDVSESTDVYGSYPSVEAELEDIINNYINTTVVESQNPPSTGAGSPIRIGGVRTWYPGWCDLDDLYI